MSRFARRDDGSIAVLAAVTFPVVLVCVALAFAAIVWSSSEHEAQRAADQAALRAAATAFLGTDFPYDEVPAVTTPLAYPDAATLAASVGLALPAALPACGTVGLPPGVLPASLALPSGCTGVGPFAPPVPLGAADQSLNVACAAAEAGMSPEQASYATRFYKGDGDPVPSCANGRVGVRLATGSPLLGFGASATDPVSGTLDSTAASQYAAVRAALASVGVRLDTSLPSLICPRVSVTVDQPVREPLFDRFTEPNGRATARRVVKNAVVVPVWNGRALTAAPGATLASTTGVGVDAADSTGATVTIPPANLNALLLAQQKQMLALLDQVDALADAALRAANVGVDSLNGTFAGIDPKAAQPLPTGATGPLESLRLTKCLRDTLAQVYDPPAGDAPTAEEVLGDAATTGEQVVLVQVGVVQAACAEPGAIDLDSAVAGMPECVRAAATPQVNPLTGVYEVPFFDVTPALVQDVDSGNYAAVPLHATQAAGAFRASLVRDAGDGRYEPTPAAPVPTSACDATVPAPTPATACQILSVTPSPSVPLPTLPLPSPTLTVSPLPSPTLTAPTLTVTTLPGGLL